MPVYSMRQVTQSDIARALGLSRSTVGLVVGEATSASQKKLRKRIGAETVALIQAKAKELGYYPNQGAQALRESRSNQIVFVNFDGYTEKAAKLIFSIGQLAREAGYELRVVDTYYWLGHVDSVTGQLMGGARPEAIILSGQPEYFEIQSIHALIKRGIPVIGLGIAMEGIPCVRYNGRDPVREITANAIQSGRRRLAILVDDGEIEDTWQRRERIAGFQDAIIEAGGAMPKSYVGHYAFAPDNGKIQSAIIINPNRRQMLQEFVRETEAARHVLRTELPPDALICVSEQYAIGALTAASELGISVPDQLSVSGFGNSPFGLQWPVPLTTVRQPNETMCQAVMEVLLTRIGQSAEVIAKPEVRIFPSEIIWRASSPHFDRDQTFISSNPHRPEVSH